MRRDSSKTAARSPFGTTNTSRSAGMAERSPKTGSTRLGATAANDANCLATSTGWRPGSTATEVPTFNRLVRLNA